MPKAILFATALLATACAPTLADRPAATDATERERVRVASVAERARVKAASEAFDGDQRAFEFMRVQGMTREEADAKVAKIDDLMSVVNALEPRLRAEHQGNYIDNIVSAWEGEVCALMLFRHDGAAILKRYGVDRTDIHAIEVTYDSEQFHAMMMPWWDRFWRAGIRVTPYQRPDLNRIIFQLHGEWDEYLAAARREGWQLPPWLAVMPNDWKPPRYACR